MAFIMKIVSDFRDYYDHCGHIYGIDEGLRCDRMPFQPAKRPEWKYGKKVLYGELNFPETVEIELAQALQDVIAGAATLEQRLWNEVKFLEKRAIVVGDHYFVVGRAYREVDMRWITERVPYGPWTVLSHDMPSWVNALTERVGRPVYAIVDKFPRDGKIELSNLIPKLSEYGIPSFLGATDAYRSIYTCLTNVLRADPDAMPESKRTDVEKVESHGFDKRVSFRKRV
ncbi:hypothetical protein FDI24_gp205 [Acidovorax phage ACP17]|uniref:Uncharacterized protein n=1 Tax=Acidovorax phage ACP17 TaxID=2010329 RepID=A0A218M355_9CAUD|nr:hypothetical protein FDI24_gp205 [Acidovorax phage ACP17]ASD50486.1 hypothetical protein [Acidovorax phage ACP17]